MVKNPIKLTTEQELERILTETYINRTSKTTKVTPNSVLSGLIAGNKKVASKAIKDIALAASQLYPSIASGESLDRAARDYGISPRFLASESSVVFKIVASEGTLYDSSTITVNGNGGVIYKLEEDVAIGISGIAYVKARSIDAGAFTMIKAYELNNLIPAPTGHIAAFNEYGSIGGRDAEQDDVFQRRILKGANIAAVGTLEKYNQVFQMINPNVLRVIYYGNTVEGKIKLAVVSQNGVSFNQSELDNLLENGRSYFSLSEQAPAGTNSYGIKLVNVNYQYVNVDFRTEIFNNYDFIEVIRNIQSKFSKLVDHRFWKPGQDKIQWDDLLLAVKTTPGVKYVSDKFFFPQHDITIDSDKLPRFAGFIVRDIKGNVVLDNSGVIQPIYYPNEPKIDFRKSVL